MKLEVTNLDFAYKFLDNIDGIARGTPIEPWASSVNPADESGELQKLGGFGYTAAGLPEPLNAVKFFIRRQGPTYSAFFVFNPKNINAFNGLSIQLEKLLGQRELGFFRTTDNGTGYVTDSQNRVIAGIMEAGEQNQMMDIGIGCNGAVPRLFVSKYRDWVLDIKDPEQGLEAIANIFLEACYSLSPREKPLPNFNVYLNP